ncbi:MAG: hypothetical protein P8X79_14780 [Reinekea sp.]
MLPKNFNEPMGAPAIFNTFLKNNAAIPGMPIPFNIKPSPSNDPQ